MKENTIKAKGINITKRLEIEYKISCHLAQWLGSEHLIGPAEKAIHPHKIILIKKRKTVIIPKNIFSNTIIIPRVFQPNLIMSLPSIKGCSPFKSGSKVARIRWASGGQPGIKISTSIT